jgi:peptidyl-prolyl cis-trans isomerase C
VIANTGYRSSVGGFTPPIVFMVLCAAVCSLACEHRDVGHPAHDPGRVVARINGDPLYRGDLDAFAPGEEPGDVTAEERKTQFDHWVATELLYDEAMRSGIGVSDEIDRKVEQYTKDLVADRLVEELLRTRAIVTREEVLAYYRSHRDEYNLEVRVSHILTNTLEDASEARKMLATRPFSWVARKMSVDRHTGAGGDLGYLSKGNMLPEFEDVVFTMKVGEISEIIESEFGYHILKLTDIRAAANELPFENVAPEISRQLLLEKRTAVYDSLIATLRNRSTIEVLDPELQYVIDVADSLNRTRPRQVVRADAAFGQAVPEPEETRRAATVEPVEPDTLEDDVDESP